jgi:hypothetical protein
MVSSRSLSGHTVGGVTDRLVSLEGNQVYMQWWICLWLCVENISFLELIHDQGGRRKECLWRAYCRALQSMCGVAGLVVASDEAKTTG